MLVERPPISTLDCPRVASPLSPAVSRVRGVVNRPPAPVGPATSRLLTGVMVGVDAGNPVVYMLAAVGLLAVAAAASYFPARRATRIDPIEALRPES